jgi:hypothetical protein
MRTNKIEQAIRMAAGATLLAALLAGCAKPAPEAAPPPPAAAPAIPDAQPPASDAAPADPTQPAPDAPPPTEPSAVPKPTSITAPASEPTLASMSAAIPSAKMGVAVDLRYSFDGEVLPNQPVMLNIAAVPRVAGTHLNVSLKQVQGLQLSAGSLSVQKASASSVYRQQFSVTRLATAPAQLRVLVTMDMPEGSAFGFFSIPLDGTAAQKQESVKQR